MGSRNTILHRILLCGAALCVSAGPWGQRASAESVDLGYKTMEEVEQELEEIERRVDELEQQPRSAITLSGNLYLSFGVPDLRYLGTGPYFWFDESIQGTLGVQLDDPRVRVSADYLLVPQISVDVSEDVPQTLLRDYYAHYTALTRVVGWLNDHTDARYPDGERVFARDTLLDDLADSWRITSDVLDLDSEGTRLQVVPFTFHDDSGSSRPEFLETLNILTSTAPYAWESSAGIVEAIESARSRLPVVAAAFPTSYSGDPDDVMEDLDGLDTTEVEGWSDEERNTARQYLHMALTYADALRETTEYPWRIQYRATATLEALVGASVEIADMFGVIDLLCHLGSTRAQVKDLGLDLHDHVVDDPSPYEYSGISLTIPAGRFGPFSVELKICSDGHGGGAGLPGVPDDPFTLPDESTPPIPSESIPLAATIAGTVVLGREEGVRIEISPAFGVYDFVNISAGATGAGLDLNLTAFNLGLSAEGAMGTHTLPVWYAGGELSYDLFKVVVVAVGALVAGNGPDTRLSWSLPRGVFADARAYYPSDASPVRSLAGAMTFSADLDITAIGGGFLDGKLAALYGYCLTTGSHEITAGLELSPTALPGLSLSSAATVFNSPAGAVAWIVDTSSGISYRLGSAVFEVRFDTEYVEAEHRNRMALVSRIGVEF